jgi:hypothetical protein
VSSDRYARRHGLSWTDVSGLGVDISVAVRATNGAGIRTSRDFRLSLPIAPANSALADVKQLTFAHGFLLDTPVDFDNDGLLEVVQNQYEAGWLGDTLRFYEWSGNGFTAVSDLLAGVFPRHSGDSDADGLLELLTQVGPATLLLEQEPGAAVPTRVAFLDTTGIAEPGSPSAVWGARLTDIDQDGRGEILSHNGRQWRVLEWNGAEYSQTIVLDNPTGVSDSELSENTFEQPEAVVGDLDGDGHIDILVGDSDGDWIIYESTSNDQANVVWTHETNRYNGGSRFAVGDLDNDGQSEFVTYAHNWLTTTSDNQVEPDIGFYYVFDATGDNSYAVRDSIPVTGEISRHGSIVAVDLDGLPGDELVVVDPPDLHVLALDPATGWRRLYHAGRPGSPVEAGVRSASVVTADFDSDGMSEVVLGGADEFMYMIDPTVNVGAPPPPEWIRAVSTGPESLRLEWRAATLDSVIVFRALPDGPYDRAASATGTTFTDSVQSTHEYVLQGWQGGRSSALSRPRLVRPHAPPRLLSVASSAADRLELQFSSAISSETKAEQFILVNSGPASSVLVSQGGSSVVLRFSGATASDTLTWHGLRDAEDADIPDGVQAVEFASEEHYLVIESWVLDPPSHVEIRFNEPVRVSEAVDPSSYTVGPSGSVSSVVMLGEGDLALRVELSGVVVGPSGRNSWLEVTGVLSKDGSQMAPDGRSIRLSGAAGDLAGVYVYPNPFNRSTHSNGVVIAGLPSDARVEVFTLDGTRVRELTETEGTGGLTWDGLDAWGRDVPSGMYLIRVEDQGGVVVLRKAAVIN